MVRHRFFLLVGVLVFCGCSLLQAQGLGQPEGRLPSGRVAIEEKTIPQAVPVPLPSKEEKEALEVKLRLEALEKAMRKRKREDLQTAERQRRYLGKFGSIAKKPYRERIEEPGIVTGIDEGKIAELVDSDLKKEAELAPFGQAFFLKGEEIAASLDTTSAPSDYALGPGDALKIIVWSEMGDETVYDVTVNPEGQVYIPILGVLGVSGLTVGQFEQTVLGSLESKFKHFKGQVTLTKIRSVQIFVAGEVNKPGAMVVSALATAFNALYRAGGPTDKGSMRTIRVMRQKDVVAEIDLYQYFLKGDKSQDAHLENGDTVFVPSVGERVTVKGEVIRPAIYELAGEHSLAEILAMAGGIEASAYTGRMRVFRWQGAERRKILDVGTGDGAGAFASFQVKNGDEIQIERALEEIGNRVRIEGPVRRPGEYAVEKGMKVSDLIAKAGGVVREEIEWQAGQIIRKEDRGQEKILPFKVVAALQKDDLQDIELAPLDVIKLFAASEVKADIEAVTIAGAIRRPGEYIYRRGMRVGDLILRAQGLSADASGEVEIARAKEGHQSSIQRLDIQTILKNPAAPANQLLLPLDRVSVLARGDVNLEAEMIVLKGEVRRPGPYALKRRGETLSEVIERAGGLSNGAFPEGAIFQRQMRNLSPEMQIQAAERVRGELYEQASLDLQADLIRAGAKFGEIAPARVTGDTVAEEAQKMMTAEGGTEGEAPMANLAAKEQTSTYGGIRMSSRAMNQDAVRIPIRLAKALTGKSPEDDVILQDGDQITIPVIPQTVSVIGAVVNPSTFLYRSRLGVGAYIEMAGGFSEHSNHRRSVVVRANGEVLPLRRVREINRGDIVLVPPKPKLFRPDKIESMSKVAQILGNLAVLYKVAVFDQ